VGEATKLATFLLGADKEYEAEVTLGLETDTLDADGRIIRARDASGITAEQARAAAAVLVGPQEQTPPMYSALKVAGRRLYELARSGLEVERQPRAITVHCLEVLELRGGGRLKLRVVCSKGTYVRTLASDLGLRLGTGGHLSALRRTRSGPFRVAEATPLGDLETAWRQGRLRWLSMAEAVAELAAARLDEAGARRVRQGRPPLLADLGLRDLAEGARLRLLDAQGGLVAIAEAAPSGKIRLVRVFG
jgi:tRNA pseudouridine55 synthase